MALFLALNGFLEYSPLKALLSMHHNISRFGSVPKNRFSCVCDMAPCGME